MRAAVGERDAELCELPFVKNRAGDNTAGTKKPRRGAGADLNNAIGHFVSSIP
jgi:hypothetical protein